MKMTKNKDFKFARTAHDGGDGDDLGGRAKIAKRCIFARFSHI